MKARWSAWRAKREQERLRKRVEANKAGGRPPVPMQTLGVKDRKIAAEAEREAPVEDDEDDTAVVRKVLELPEIARASASTAARRSAGEPKISHGAAGFRLPSPSLLRMAERSEKVPEDELKECARAIEEKCREFDVGGHVTQINPGPVVTTYEFKPEAGIKYSRITGLADDLCLGAARRIHFDRAHP